MKPAGLLTIKPAAFLLPKGIKKIYALNKSNLEISPLFSGLLPAV